MPSTGSSPWNSAHLQDKRWRRAVEQLQAPTTAPAHRLKAARKILRDGNDLACCMLFSVCRAADPAAEWGRHHPFDAVRGAVRFRALRILGRPSKLQDRDHEEAAQLLPWIVKPRDQVILTRQLRTRSLSRLLPALQALHRVVNQLDPMDAALRAELHALVSDGGQPASVHHALAAVLSHWSASEALQLLEHGTAFAAHTHRWPYLSVLVQRAPALGRPLAEAHLARLGPHHVHAADIQRTLEQSALS